MRFSRFSVLQPIYALCIACMLFGSAFLNAARYIKLPNQLSYAPPLTNMINVGRNIVGSLDESVVINARINATGAFACCPVLLDTKNYRYYLLTDAIDSGWLDSDKDIDKQLAADDLSKVQGLNNYATTVSAGKIFGAVSTSETLSQPAIYEVSSTSADKKASPKIVKLPSADGTQTVVLRTSETNDKIFGMSWFDDSGSSAAAPAILLWEHGADGYSTHTVSVPDTIASDYASGQTIFTLASASLDLSVIGLNKISLVDGDTIQSQAAFLVKGEQSGPPTLHILTGSNSAITAVSGDGSQTLVVFDNGSVGYVNPTDLSTAYETVDADKMNLGWVRYGMNSSEVGNLRSFQHYPTSNDSEVYGGAIFGTAYTADSPGRNYSGIGAGGLKTSPELTFPYFIADSSLVDMSKNGVELQKLQPQLLAGRLPPVEYRRDSGTGIISYIPITWETGDSLGSYILEFNYPETITLPPSPLQNAAKAAEAANRSGLNLTPHHILGSSASPVTDEAVRTSDPMLRLSLSRLSGYLQTACCLSTRQKPALKQ